MIPIILDFETRSAIDLTQQGTSVYARDPSTRALCLGYQIGLEGTTYVKPYLNSSSAPPVRLMQALQKPDAILVAHNALFERAVWQHVMHWPVEPAERWYCTSNLAGLHNLPQALGELTRYLWPTDAEAQKDLEGKRLINLLSKPQRGGIYNNDPTLLAQLYAYCAQDVKVTAKVWDKLPMATTLERQIQVADIRANELGYQVDRDFCEAAEAIDTELQNLVIAECVQRTGLRPTQTTKLKQWLADRNYVLPDMSRQTIEQARLNYPTWPQYIRRVLELRIAGSRGSTQKFRSLLRHCTPEFPRVTHHTRYAAGNTGRWIARGAQIHNFRSRNLISYDLPGIKHQVMTNTLPKDTDIRNYVGGAVRAAIIAKPGYHLALGDYSGMENRMLMYLAGEERQLKLIRQGMDVYRDLATRVFGIPDPAAIDPWQRQICKHMVLGLGFGMGATAFFTNLKFKFQVDLNRDICQAIVGDELSDLTHTYARRLTDNPRLRAYITSEVCLDNQPLTGKILMGLVTTRHLVKVFRGGFADLSIWWKLLESTVQALLDSPVGTVVDLGRSGCCHRAKSAIVFILPSGRSMYYWKPGYRSTRDPVSGERRQELVYQQATGGRIKTLNGYGARFGANLVQGQSRDIMAIAFRDLSNSLNYQPIVTVHDEIISETLDPDPTHYESRILASANDHAWIQPIPIKVDADISPCWLSKG